MTDIALHSNGLHSAVLVLLLVVLSLSVYGVLRSMGRSRISPGRLLHAKRRKRGARTLAERWLFVPAPDHPARRTKQSLLNGGGFRIEAGFYMVVIRLAMIAALAVGVAAGMLRELVPGAVTATESAAMLILSLSVLVIGFTDHFLLDKLKRVRRFRIMRDIDTLCRQLLYYSDFGGNLHGKLMRCMPFVKALRSEWAQLTAEWYQGAEYALSRFQDRVATEEGASFAETLNALRQYDHERYYELLKERIADYKEKLELNKEGRKESISYLLFVMSGIPIIYTFRLFIYPWVAEGQKLFNSIS